MITPRGPVCTAEPAGAASPPPAAAACTPDAAGRARCSSGERAAARTHSTCTALNRCTLRCDLPKPGLAAFGMDSARTKTHGRATVACQKGGMYPTFDSAAGSGEIPVFFGILPDLILRVTWFDSASGPIPVNVPHCLRRVRAHTCAGRAASAVVEIWGASSS